MKKRCKYTFFVTSRKWCSINMLLHLANIATISKHFHFKHRKNRLKYTILNTHAQIWRGHSLR